MRTYILALTKYGIAAMVIAFTALAFWLLAVKEQQEAEKIRVLTLIQNGMILVFQLLSFFTLYIAVEDARYMLLGLVVMLLFFAIFFLYDTLYAHANMPLFNDMCMLLSVGLVIQARLSLDNAVHQLVVAAAGLVIAFFLPLFRHKFYLLKKPKYLYGMLSIAVLAVVMLLGSTTLGANLTYTIAGLTFQPSEFMKIVFLLFLASTLQDIKDFKEFLVITAFAAAHVLLLIGSTDLGSGLIYYVVFMFMAFLATGQKIVLIGGTALLSGGAVACYYLFEHIQQRVQAFLDPWSLIDSIGYQIAQSLFAISAGGLWGTGLGQGTPEDIPFVESDFIFAAVCEELGQILGVCVILIGLNCFIVMLRLSAGFADRFYRLLAYGTAIAYVFQMFLTIGGETKFIPLTGVTLPFISYGGSSILTTLIMFTLIEVMCILRGERIDELKAKREKARLPEAVGPALEGRERRALPDTQSGRRGSRAAAALPEEDGRGGIRAGAQSRRRPESADEPLRIADSRAADVEEYRARSGRGGSHPRSSSYYDDEDARYDSSGRRASAYEHDGRPKSSRSRAAYDGADRPLRQAAGGEYDSRTRRSAAYEYEGRTGASSYPSSRSRARSSTGSIRSSSDGDDSYWDE